MLTSLAILISVTLACVIQYDRERDEPHVPHEAWDAMPAQTHGEYGRETGKVPRPVTVRHQCLRLSDSLPSLRVTQV